MIKENRVSLWLGYFEKKAAFKEYIKGSYDEKGNYIPSKFQENFAVKGYDMDAIESEWISIRCSNVDFLLAGFPGDDEIVPQFEEIFKQRTMGEYNSVVILYNFEYVNGYSKDENMEYIGCADVTL